MLDILLLALGFVLLVKGSDVLIDGAVGLARRFEIPELAVGLVIVAFGTSAPEFVVSLSSALGGHSGIAIGNIVGSNIFNLFAVLGFSGLVAPIVVKDRAMRANVLFSLAATALLLLLANASLLSPRDTLGRIDGAVMLLVFVFFLTYAYLDTKSGEDPDHGDTKPSAIGPFKSSVLTVLGIAALAVGADMVVDSAVALAKSWGIGEKVVAIAIVSVGTSLPELVVSITAVVKKKGGIAVGNIIGSNIFNILFVLGTSAALAPIEYSPLFNADVAFLIFGTAVLFWAMFTGCKKGLDRITAAAFVLLYVGYMVYVFLR